MDTEGSVSYGHILSWTLRGLCHMDTFLAGHRGVCAIWTPSYLETKGSVSYGHILRWKPRVLCHMVTFLAGNRGVCVIWTHS